MTADEMLELLEFKKDKDGHALKVPHIAWNEVEYPDEIPERLFEGIPNKSAMYFVHSFFAKPREPKTCVGVTEYGINRFCSAVCSGNVRGVQFHPELSGKAGLRLLENFVKKIL